MGLYKFQVREQVLPIVEGLAKPDHRPLARLGRNKNHFQPFSNHYSCQTYRPSESRSTRNVHGIIICCFTSHAERGVAFLFSALPLSALTALPAEAHQGEGGPLTPLPAEASRRRQRLRRVKAKAGLNFLTYVICNQRTQTRNDPQHSGDEKPWRKNRHAHSLRFFYGPDTR